MATQGSNTCTQQARGRGRQKNQPTRAAPPRRRHRGIGLYTDDRTGEQVYIASAEGDVHGTEGNVRHIPDPEVRFPIPKERVLKRSRWSKARKVPGRVPKKIDFVADGSISQLATDLPYNGPGLQWMGGRAVTVDGLRKEVGSRMGNDSA